MTVVVAIAGWMLAKRIDRRQSPLTVYLKWLSLPTIQVDTLIMRAVDIMLCFPSFFLILTVVALLPPSIYNIMVIIGLTSWMGTTRFVRAEFLSLREQDFVGAARALGISDARIIFRHIMPNAVAPVLVSAQQVRAVSGPPPVLLRPQQQQQHRRNNSKHNRTNRRQ